MVVISYPAKSGKMKVDECFLEATPIKTDLEIKPLYTYMI